MNVLDWITLDHIDLNHIELDMDLMNLLIDAFPFPTMT